MSSLIIKNASIHGRPGRSDVTVENGLVTRIEYTAAALRHDRSAPVAAASFASVDADGGLLARSFVEPHVHPDKSFSLSDLPPDETFELRNFASPFARNFARAAHIKAAFTPERVAHRARRAFELAVSNGVTRMRANIDVDSTTGLRCFEGVMRAREEVADILDVDVVAFPQEGLGRDPGAFALLREALNSGADLIGGWPNVEEGEEAQRAHVMAVFDLAEEFDVDVDIHADCLIDERERMLEVIADETLARGFHGRVMASHCCGIECYHDDARHVADKVAEADVRVAVIPMNLRRGKLRGLSRPHLLREAGAKVVLGSDNLNDGWYPLGTLNPLDRAYMALVGGGFSNDQVDAVWQMVAGGAAHALDDRSRAWDSTGSASDVQVGMAADLVLLGARDRLEALRRPGGAITTIKAGRIVARRMVEERFMDEPPLRGEPAFGTSG